MTGFKCKATPTNSTDYGYCKKAVELANQSCGVHITPLVINSLGGRQTDRHTHTNYLDKSNFKNQVYAG